MFGKEKVPAQARILADEGYTYAQNSQDVALQLQTYIVEVHPDSEPAFRCEVKAWVSWPDRPKEGDDVRVLYKPGTKKVELDLAGDPRFDWRLRAANEESEKAARREALLNGPVPQGPLTPQVQGGATAPAMDEADAIADLFERHERGEISDEELRAEEAKFLNEGQ